MNETEKAWIAGILDGEGCIGLYKIRRKHRYKNKIYSKYSLSVAIKMKHKETIQKLHALYPDGYFITYKNSLYEFKLNDNKALTFLNVISKYLVTKKSQYLIVKDYFNTRTLTLPGNKLSQTEIEFRDDFILRLKQEKRQYD